MSKIAVDVESVLANTNEAVLRSTEKIDRSELLGEWDLSDQLWQIYSGVSDAVWRHNPDSIPPEEPMIDQYTRDFSHRHDIDIVTARPHVDESMVWWLDQHNISYNNFISIQEPKHTLDYDVYIDDNPDMVGECRLLLRHQAWNESIDTTMYPDCERIYSLAEAEAFI